MRTVLPSILAVAGALGASGCGVTVRNHTPASLVRNASGIYPVEVAVRPRSSPVHASSLHAELIVWNQAAQMERLTPPTADEARFVFPLSVPADVSEVYYHFRVHYEIGKPFVEVEKRQMLFPQGAPRKQYLLRILNRASAGLDSERGRVGATIAVLGKGFTPDDQVSIGGELVRTYYRDASVLRFQIPPLQPNQAYPVEIVGGAGDTIKVGTLLVDVADLQLSPNPVLLVRGARAFLAVRVPHPAPAGGLRVNLAASGAVVSGVPESVTIQEGATETLLRVTAAATGSGTLTLDSLGFRPLTVPLHIIEAP